MRTSTILLFLLFTIHLHAQKIKAYEYWVDDDPSTKVFTSITPVTNLHLQQALPVNMCSPGFHIFNIRFIDTTNTWSVISSQYFVKNPPATETDRQIAAYEYWIDDNSASRIYQTVVPSSQLHLTNPLDLNSVSMGFHVLSLRFKDNMGNWSSTQTQYFTKYGSPRIIPNKIVYCRFWYDTDMATQETLNLRLPAAIYNWADTVETPFLTIGNHTINYQFKDSSQTYSSISTDTFSVLSCLPHGGRMISGTASVHTGQAGVTYSIRKIKNATSYTWSVPAGASIVAGNNTHSIMVDYSLSAVSGDVSVYAANSCGNGNVMIYPVTVNAPSGPPNWIPVPNLQYNMNVIGKIQLSPGVYSLNENDLLGAFVGAECRGVAHPFAALGGTLFMTIGSNLQSGETVTFKVYLASANEILDANETIPFQNQGETGTMANPFIFTYGVTQCTLNVTPSNQDVAYGPSASASFAVMSNCDWIASSDQTWCSVTPSGSGNGAVTVNYSQNITTLPRIAHITVTSPEITPIVVTLTQAGAPGPPIWTPVPNLQYNMSVIGKVRLSPGVFSLNENDILGAFVGTECRGVANPFASLSGTLFLTIGSNNLSGENVTFKIFLASTNEIVNANETISFQNGGEAGTMDNPFLFTFPILNNVVIQGTTIITGQTSCYNALQTITVAGGGTNFVVQNGGVVTMIAGQKISFLAGTTVQSGGQLNAYITATNSYCSSLGSSMVNALVKEEINLPDAQALSNLLVYPNPTEGKFILELPGEELNSPVLVRIYNMKGLEVLTKQLTVAGKSEFSLESQTPGIYLVNMIKEGEMKMIKILKY